MSAAIEAYATAERGDLRAARALLPELESRSDALSRAWSLALRAVGALAEPEQWRAPSLDELDRFRGVDAAARSAACIACAAMEKAAVVRFDEAGLAAFVDVHGALVDGLSELESAGHRAARAFLRLATTELGGLAEEAAEIEAAAARSRHAALVIDAASLRALALLGEGRLDEATPVARRASRMARTEALPAQEYLAHLVLARVRRLQGKPAMSTRILSALASVAPRPWWGWIAWEQLLSAGPDVASPLIEALGTGDDGPVAKTAVGFHRTLAAAATSERSEVARAFHALGTMAPTFADLAAELDQARIALDPDAPIGAAPPALLAWLRGDVDSMAPGLPGLCIAAGEEAAPNEPAAWVVAEPSRAPRRVVRAGVGLAERAVRVRPTRMKVGREDTALAVLTLAGPDGLLAETCFARVYGFDYKPDLHEGTFRVLLHRLKARIEGVGQLSWHDGIVALALEGPLIVADPRCSRATDDRIMLALARSGSATAKEIAAALRIPLRTVQSAIRELVDEGACRAEQEGRIVRYVVEDTTFSEPTRH